MDKTGSSSGSSAKAAKESGGKASATPAAAEEEGKDSEGISSAIVGWSVAGVAVLAAFAFWRNGKAKEKAHKEALDDLQKKPKQERSKVEAQMKLMDIFGQRGREQQAEILAPKRENTVKQEEMDRTNRELDRQKGLIPRDISFAQDGMPTY